METGLVPGMPVWQKALKASKTNNMQHKVIKDREIIAFEHDL